MIAKFLLLAFAAPLVLSNTTPDPMINSGYPPERFMGDAAAIVVFTNDVPSICGQAPPGFVIRACASEKQRTIVMPNPCHPQFDGEEFAKIMCHELGHINGWPREHGE